LDNGRGKKLGIIRRLPDGYQAGVNLPLEKDQFYYHGDHLGSSNMITDAYGAVYQHLEYFPYGETWIEEGGSYGGNTPGYKFTGKELDSETGLYYYGARYYDPVLNKWISADPAFDKFLPELEGDDNPFELPGIGGIYNPINLNQYAYAHQNPVKLTDPDGQFVNILVGAAAGFVSDVGFQVATQLISGKGLDEIEIDFKSATISAAIGATGVGVANVAKKGYQAYQVAKTTKRLQQITTKAASKIDDVVKAGNKSKVFSPKQLKAQVDAAKKGKNLEKAHRGSAIDKEARKMVDQDKFLQKQGVKGKPNKGPDFTDKYGKTWDMTTKAQEAAHKAKYGEELKILYTDL
jgi:RHS repeat-associated protein